MLPNRVRKQVEQALSLLIEVLEDDRFMMGTEDIDRLSRAQQILVQALTEDSPNVPS